ncbi:MAG: PA0069 family radical SAM protein [Pseudomonadota bacterium]
MSAHTPKARPSSPLPAVLQPRGRGAKSNAAGRYESETREPFDDGWNDQDRKPPKLATRLVKDGSRTIISKNDSPDIGFDRSINPYRGCEHGCVYCYARPTHAYWGYSAGIDFESVILFKPGAAGLLRKALSKPGYQAEPIMIGAITDPYQPMERRLQITRSLLEVFVQTRHPMKIITKSASITRDIDLLAELAEQKLAGAAISLTTLDRRLSRAMEPRASSPERRLDAIEALAKAGIPVTVMTAPVIPGLTDHELENLLQAAANVGARSAGYVLLRLPLEVRDLFQQWLKEERPAAASKIMSLIRQTRGGRDYDPTFGRRGVGEGPVAELIAKRFKTALRRLKLDTPREPLRTDLFRPPGEDARQLSLL